MTLRIEQISDTKIWIHDGSTNIMEIDSSDGVRINSSLRIGTANLTLSGDELAALDGLTATSTELNTLAGVAAGTVTAGKAIVTTTNKHIDAIVITDGGLALGTDAGTAVTSTAAELNILDGVTAAAAELNLIDGSIAGTAVASKALALGADKNVDTLSIADSGLKLGSGAGTAVSSTAAELNLIDGSVAGTAVASKALVLGADKNVDTLAIADSGLKLGSGAGTAVTKTAAQLNTMVAGAAGGYMIARSAAPVALDGSNPTSVAHGLTTCLAVFVQLVGSAAPGDSTSVLTAVINGANIDVYAWKTDGTDPTFVASTGTETFNWFAVGT